jgi:hypothetical protein
MDRFGEVGPIDVGNEPEGHPAIAVVLECFVRHHRSEVGAPDADVDHITNPFARMTRPGAVPDPIGEFGHLVKHRVDLGYHVLAIDNDRCPFGRPESYVQDGSVLRDIYLLASKHGIDPRSQAAFLRQLKEKFKSLVGDPIFRIVYTETRCLDREALATFWIIGEELSEVQFSHLPVMGFECLPNRA